MEAKKRGRPVGTTKENKKKMYSFRLSIEEAETVKKLLAKMRGKLVILFFLLSFCLPINAQTIQGGVSYTEETARQEAFQGVYKFCPFSNMLSYERTYKLFVQNDDVLEIQEFNAKAGLFRMKTLAVIYKDMPNRVYYYEQTRKGNKCLVVEDFEYPINDPNVEHRKSVKYDAKTGKLLTVAIDVAPNESYVYDANQKLIAHWVGEKAYMHEKRLKITRKIIYSAQ